MLTILKGYILRLYPTDEQKELINKTIGCTRFIYNYFLSDRINDYKISGKSKSCYDQIKKLPALCKEYPWLSEIDSCSLRTSLFNLEKVKKALLEYYGIIDLENSIARLAELEAAIKNKEITIPNLTSLMGADFSKYEVPSYFNPSKKHKNKGKIRKFMNLKRKNLRELIDLLTNEEQYATVKDVFVEDKLKLYFAY